MRYLVIPLFVLVLCSSEPSYSKVSDFPLPPNLSLEEQLAYFLSGAAYSEVFFQKCISKNNSKPSGQFKNNIEFVKKSYTDIYTAIGMSAELAKKNLDIDYKSFNSEISQHIQDNGCKDPSSRLYSFYVIFKSWPQDLITSQLNKIIRGERK